MDLFPHSSPDRSWSWIKDDFRPVPRVYLGLPEGTIGDYTLVWKGADPLTRTRFSVLIGGKLRKLHIRSGFLAGECREMASAAEAAPTTMC